MSNYTFASMPSVNISRSKFHRTQPHNTSFNLGELVILGFDEVIPGSTHKLDLGSLVRMSTPIAPIMDDIQFDIYSFFVPMRLTWEHWKNFMGESESAGLPQTTYTVPNKGSRGSYINTIADDLGIPAFVADRNQEFKVNVLPFRGVFLIYNRFFRNQNVEAPYLVYKGDYGYVLEGAGDDYTIDVDATGLRTSGNATGTPARLKAYKLPDYITSALPYAQKGTPVKIPGTDGLIPVITGENISGLPKGDSIRWYNALTGDSIASANAIGITGGSTFTGGYPSEQDFSYALMPANLYGNRNVIDNNTINDLRFAFQLQKALEKDALYGSRYWEVLRAHYAVTSPDATLQDPELLGHIKFDINISQVLQQTGYVDPTSTTLGTPGANSVTANKGHLFTASFTEHGYIYHIAVARQKRHTYSNALNRLWSRTTRWDFYHPVFANLGAQKVLNKEVFAAKSSEILGLGDKTFGFQEAWAEYRFLPGYNSGYLNPYRAGALDYWTLADDYDSTPTLSKSFLLESRDNLIRALVTGSTGPDFIGSFYFKDTVVNPMPLYSIPGFADHH